MVDYIGSRLGNYQLTRLIGTGAFAQVYLGEHIYLGTMAAIKILKAQSSDSPLDQFNLEARLIARLIHPNIVRVLEFGVDDSTPFLVLDYAPNGTLRQRHPLGTPLALPTVVSYLQQIAEALQYAHDEKLVHRDVKPENMLLGRRNEVLLSDFGIALMLQTLNYDQQQAAQDVAGTLAYIAPEQIQGQPRPASDQYSLAVIAYEWLSGRRLFDGSPAEMISQHLGVNPAPLRASVPGIASPVEEVVLTALAKDPNRRFRNVRAFALALEQASRLPPAPSVLAPVASSSLNSVQMRPSGAPGSVVASYRGHQQAVRSLSWSADSQRIVSASNDKTAHVWEGLNGNAYQVYQDISDAVGLVAWSPDGSRIATAGADAQIRVWNVATNRLLSTYAGHAGASITALAWSPTQYILASATNAGMVHVWDAASGQTLTRYQNHSGNVSALAWCPVQENGAVARIVSGGDDGSLQIWEAASGKTLARYGNQTAPILSSAWSPAIYSGTAEPADPTSTQPRTSRVACGRKDGMVQMWDTSSDREVLSYRYPPPVSVVAWSPDGKRFANASAEKNVEVWDTLTNRKLVTFSHSAPLRTMAWSPNGKYIASGGDDAMIQVWFAP